MSIEQQLTAANDNPDGLWIVAVIYREDTPDDPNSDFTLRESWNVTTGLQEAKDTYAQLQQHPEYFAGGVFACIESDVYPTLLEELKTTLVEEINSQSS